MTALLDNIAAWLRLARHPDAPDLRGWLSQRIYWTDLLFASGVTFGLYALTGGL